MKTLTGSTSANYGRGEADAPRRSSILGTTNHLRPVLLQRAPAMGEEYSRVHGQAEVTASRSLFTAFAQAGKPCARAWVGKRGYRESSNPIQQSQPCGGHSLNGHLFCWSIGGEKECRTVIRDAGICHVAGGSSMPRLAVRRSKPRNARHRPTSLFRSPRLSCWSSSSVHLSERRLWRHPFSTGQRKFIPARHQVRVLIGGNCNESAPGVLSKPNTAP